MRLTWLLLLGLTACAGGPRAADYKWVVMQGNLARRHQMMQDADEGSPVMKIVRDGDLYHVTDLLLGKHVDWMVPGEDSKPRLLRFQHTTLTCQAGLIRHGEEAADLQTGDAALLLKGGTLRKLPKKE